MRSGAGASAAEVVEAIGQGAGGGGLVTGQRVAGCHRKGDSRDVTEVGHRVPRAVLEGPESVHEGCLGTGHGQTSYSAVVLTQRPGRPGWR